MADTGNRNNICNVTIAKSITNNYMIPLDSPISGKQGFRESIGVKAGIVEGTITTSQNFQNPTMIFSGDFSGEFIVATQGTMKEGGETSNPVPMKLLSIIGISNG